MQEYVELLTHVTENVLDFCYLKKRSFPESRSLDGQVIVITGATRSSGKQAAIECAAKGAHVVLACRDVTLAQQVQQEIVEAGHRLPIIVHLDLCSFDSIMKAVNDLKNKVSRIDSIIHNAGMISRSRQVTLDGIESTIQANFAGPVLLTEKLLSMLNKSSDPRVIFVSSLIHHAAWKNASVSMDDFFKQEEFSTQKVYAESKAACLMYCRSLTETHAHLRCYAVDPGIFASDIVREKPRWMETLLGYNVARPFLRSTSDATASIVAPLYFPRDTYDRDKFYFCDGYEKKCSQIIFNDQLCKQVCHATHQLLSQYLTEGNSHSLSSQ